MGVHIVDSYSYMVELAIMLTDGSAKSRESQLTFEWSFKPIILLLGFFGIKISSHRHNFSTVLRGLFFLFLNLFVNNVSFLYIFTKNLAGNTSKPKGTAAFLNSVGGILVKVLLAIGIHFAFLFISFSSKWKDLWDSLLAIQQEMNLSASFYRSCRRNCYFALLLLILVGILLIMLTQTFQYRYL